MATEWYLWQYIRCGKAKCKTCPHGPYLYRYYTAGAKRKSEYIGKRDPRTGFSARPEAGKPLDPRDLIFNGLSATTDLALRILGMPIVVAPSYLNCLKRFKALVLQHHPDRGGEIHEMQLVNAAWSYLKARYRW